MIECAAAPPSDHERKLKDVPPIVCGDGAATEFSEPSITVFVNGALAAVAPSASVAPVGLEASVRATVRGSSRTDWVSCNPPASVAVRRSSR